MGQNEYRTPGDYSPKQVSRLSKNVLSTLVSLIEQYQDRDILAADYLDNSFAIYADLEENELTSLIELFLGINRYEQFLNKIVDYFYCLTKRSDHKDKIILIVINYLILFVLNRESFEKIKDVLVEFSLKKGKQILQLYNRKNIYDDLLEAGCEYFDYEHVIDKILSTFSTDKTIFKDLLNVISSSIELKNLKNVRKITVAVTPRQLKYIKKTPNAPRNSPRETEPLESLPPPKTTYKPSKIIEKIELEKLKNKNKSFQLFNEAQLNAPILQKNPPHFCQPEPEVKPCKRHSKTKFSGSGIPVKANAATLLREAARVIKEEQKEIKKIEALEAGGANYMKYECLVKEIRDEEEQLHLQEIERKHLQGLLSREEAIIARHKLEKENKLKRNQFEKEKQKLVNYIKEIRENEEEKIRNTIHKVQLIQKNIEVKKQNLQKLKNKTAQEVAEVSKQLLEEAVKKRKEELNEKMCIIEEIKALNNLRDLRTTEFDPSETMNFGLMCEMSLAELQERLIILRIDFKEDLEKRQTKIKQKRFKQQKFLTETKEFIDIHRAYRRQMINEEKEKKTRKNFPDSNEIANLRLKLQEAREKKNQIKCKKIMN